VHASLDSRGWDADGKALVVFAFFLTMKLWVVRVEVNAGVKGGERTTGTAFLWDSQGAKAKNKYRDPSLRSG
jgi:hypothetical protein